MIRQAALISLLSVPASAEVLLSLNHQGWNVAMHEGDTYDVLFCTLMSESNGNVFSMTVNEEGQYLISSRLRAYPVAKEIDWKIVMDSRHKEGVVWTLEGAESRYMNGSTHVHFDAGQDPAQREFVRDFMRHESLTVWSGENFVIAGWSLSGSADAVKSWDECRQAIMGEIQ